MSDVYVKVRAAGETYALPVTCVREVAELGELTAVAGAAAHLLGVRNVHGQVVPVIDLARALGGPPGGTPARIVVAESGGCIAGLAVDEVVDIGPLPDGRSEPESEYIAEAVLDDGALVGVVRLDRVFAELRDGHR